MFSAQRFLARALIHGQLPPERSWPRVAQVAGHSKVSALLYDVLRLNGVIEEVPQEIRARLHRAYTVNLARNAFILDELRRLTGSFAAAGIPFMPLKGAALLKTVYRRRIAVRRLEDVDLLVPKAGFDAAGAVLTRCGYREQGREDRPARMFFRSGGLFPVHLHRHIVNLGGVYFQRTGRLIPMERFWDGEGVGLQLMRPAMMLLSLCEHALRHGWARLNLLYDIHSLIEQHGTDIPWRSLLADARSWQLEGAVYTALSLRRDLFGAAVPGEAARHYSAERGRFMLERIYMEYIKLAHFPFEDACALLFPSPLKTLSHYGFMRLASR